MSDIWKWLLVLVFAFGLAACDDDDSPSDTPDAGDMVDGVGFWNNAMATGFDPAGKNIVLAGAGAAGTAIAHAFAERGGARLDVIEPETARLTALAACLQGFATEIVYG